jgi:protein-L-isoaspartate(D-aspartate) O-methyltransferase
MNSSGFTFRRVREEMIEMLLEMGIRDFRVLDAMSQVPRHIFLDEALRSRAYENRSLTIGYKQTISQPYIVARMTELLISHTKSRGKVLNQVLELGSGCGYQSAVLSYFCEQVHAVERIKPLVTKARENLANLKIRNIEILHGDGFTDWDKNKKYDGVICAAAPREYPHELVDSLNLSAKIVLPVGNSSNQKLNVITKISEDEILEESFEDVSFVPMLPGKSFDGSEL